MRYRMVPSSTKGAIDIGYLIGFNRVIAGNCFTPVYVDILDNEIDDVREILSDYEFVED